MNDSYLARNNWGFHRRLDDVYNQESCIVQNKAVINSTKRCIKVVQ